MSNYDTVNAITANVQKVLKGLGIHFNLEAYDDEAAIPATVLPHGQIFYECEFFEYGHGQKPLYIEVQLRLHVVLMERAPADIIREQQTWVHAIRGALTITALNIGDLAVSKYVSRVTTESVKLLNSQPRSAVEYVVLIRYREV